MRWRLRRIIRVSVAVARRIGYQVGCLLVFGKPVVVATPWSTERRVWMCANGHWSSVGSATRRRVVSGMFRVCLMLRFRAIVRRRIVLILISILRLVLWARI